jgi:[ribosomal protein S5]-alanine N-acetyltransferase
MQIFLETDRLILRQFTLSDANLIFELDSNPEVTRFTDPTVIYGSPVPDYDIIQNRLLPQWLAYYQRSEGYGFWAAIEKSSQAFIGWFHLKPTPDPQEVELGYRLNETSWGKGYATEGSKALILKAFDELGFDRVSATALADHRASIHVMEKAGLQFAGNWLYERTQQPAVKYVLSRATFAASRRENMVDPP